jgi:hypothetical protein
MGNVESLCLAYERFIGLPWNVQLAGPQKVLICIYDPRDERRLRTRVGEFEMATRRHRHDWSQIDLTDAFARWMADHDYRESYFESPEDLDMALDDFARSVEECIWQAAASSNNTVVALLGIGSLFGLARVSRVLEAVATSISGRLLVFFPGERDGSNYRLLGARDGWNYLATPIQAEEPRL